MNWVLPDERHHLRIQLKVAVLDVRSGSWSVFSPKPFADTRTTIHPRKEAIEQKQIQHLKQLAYESAVTDLVQRYQ